MTLPTEGVSCHLKNRFSKIKLFGSIQKTPMTRQISTSSSMTHLPFRMISNFPPPAKRKSCHGCAGTLTDGICPNLICPTSPASFWPTTLGQEKLGHQTE